MKSKSLIVSLFIILCFNSCKFEKEEISLKKLKINKTIPMNNPITFFEIPVLDLDRAIKFYNSVFGFEFEKENIDGNEMAFFPQNENGKGISGALAKGKTYKPSKTGILIYFTTTNLEENLANVVLNGGKILYPKTKIGDLGFVAEFEDSEGNKIALHQN